MTRTYSVKFKNKSKLLKSEEAIEDVKNTILKDTIAKSVDITDDGQIITVEVDNEQDFQAVVNVFRKIDDKSEVSYKFALNMN
jgi:hypothetical protein